MHVNILKQSKRGNLILFVFTLLMTHFYLVLSQLYDVNILSTEEIVLRTGLDNRHCLLAGVWHRRMVMAHGKNDSISYREDLP